MEKVAIEFSKDYIKTLDLESLGMLIKNYRNNIKTASENMIKEPVTDEDYLNNDIEKEILDESVQKLHLLITTIIDVIYPSDYVTERGWDESK